MRHFRLLFKKWHLKLNHFKRENSKSSRLVLTSCARTNALKGFKLKVWFPMILVNFHLLCSCSCHLPKVFSSKFTIVFLLKAVHNKIVGGLSPLAFCTAGLKPHYNLFCELLLPRIQNANLAKDLHFLSDLSELWTSWKSVSKHDVQKQLGTSKYLKKERKFVACCPKAFQPTYKIWEENHRKSKVKTFSTHHINCELSSRG